MNVEPTAIPDVLLLTPRVFEDERGFFMETYQAEKFAALGVRASFVQDNHSRSKQGVLRGLHYQIRQPQGKLIRAVLGEIFDVAVDIRRASPTFGKWVGARLSAENKQQLWIPAGFAHGYYVMSEWAEIVYKATDYYAPQWERAILWNDPQIAVEWPVWPDVPLLLSSKDRDGVLLSQAEVYQENK
ncbi:MAG: dTDP-4-dehydrorhamnose 3,5-epimerase [Anaerolineaceae bacterium]|jgi:dTDP-4-dehydrorhamnose 3,5-epimerase|nr:dTDP-4-dehydrorhamnose 3,5-epimerase [Anaerolineales bacterium]OQY87084.1 MAG: dTDP-4-dehydrorhamnose 3,5-epimerase [Anaerolineae bacterium UTCFX3]GER80393.1 dTDP-4-dehydrorhamnose 3,5-epimerase [Candidatus Denitrolinea symbiosum]GIK09611.1 MAG: dTDP-4-dehydrorhamnose 3,5-epimerase [Chloroflexota bacterium]GJQ39678.1 MAG: dTDP-4-dehydrorhamnose 3,5-epimerase [Anaerolineaceae bacterium]